MQSCKSTRSFALSIEAISPSGQLIYSLINNYDQTVIDNQIKVTLVETYRGLILTEYQIDVLIDYKSVQQLI